MANNDLILTALHCNACDQRHYQVKKLLGFAAPHPCHQCGYPHLETIASVRITATKVKDGPWIVGLFKCPDLRQELICVGSGENIQMACMDLIAAVAEHCRTAS